MTRLERWVAATINGRPDPDEQQLLHRYAVWHLLRRLRRRTGGAETTHNQLVTVRQHVRAATVLLDWLNARNLTLVTCTQGDLENWMTSDDATHRREAGHFVRWARTQKLTSLDLPRRQMAAARPTIAGRPRPGGAAARRLLHDDHAQRPETGVAGLLVLLYAQWPSPGSARLTTRPRHRSAAARCGIRLGRERRCTLPEPAWPALARQLVAGPPRARQPLGDPGSLALAVPRRAARPPGQLRPARASGCRQLGLHPGQARSTALFQLAAEPARRAAGPDARHPHRTSPSPGNAHQHGDWTTYAADVSRRKPEP